MNVNALVGEAPCVDSSLVYVETSSKRYIVKQPETERYFRLSAEVVQVMQSLDGTKTIDVISHQFHLKPSVVQHIVDQLARLDLLEHQRQQEARDKQKKSRWRHTRMFFVQCDVITNDGWMDRVYQILRLKYVFRSWLCIALPLLYSGAFVMYMFYGADLRPALEQHSHFSAANLLLLAMVTIPSVVLHELAHSFTCKHFGGKVRALGVGFYFFIPVFYTDVSDVWLFAKRYQRLLTHGAGLLMNFFLASVALLLLPFALHHVVLMQVIADFYLASFLYVLINFNPLIKLDGYFLLADALGIENMMDKAMKTLFGGIGQKLSKLGIIQAKPQRKNRVLPRWEKAFLQLYALVSLMYIGFILFYIPQAYSYLLAPYLGRWSQIIVIGLLTLSVIIPLWKTWRKTVRAKEPSTSA
jgi:Zn-dependent protease